MEYFRKDIECYFGSPKQHFRMLRIPNMLKEKGQIGNVMFVIVAIKNMVHDHVVATEEIRICSV